MFKNQSVVLAVVLALVMVFGQGCEKSAGSLDASMYNYRDTKKLVRFAYEASLVLQREGPDGIDFFRKNRADYITSDYYLYIDGRNGVSLFNAGMPHLEGKDLSDITDKNGKKIMKLLWEAQGDPSNPHGWVHYSWWEPGKLYPVPKSSCNFKVKIPGGQEVLVGAGMDFPHEEREFIRIIVDEAADLIESRGRGALDAISDPTSRFNFRDVRVFVFRPDGTMDIGPAINSRFPQANILDCVDESGQKFFIRALEELESKDSVWQTFLAKNRYQKNLVKKCLYIRKTRLEGQIVYVAAITNLPEPSF